MKNNEIFNIIDHVNLNKIKYLNKELKSKIKSTEIILVAPLNSLEEINDVNKCLEINYDNAENCGEQKQSLVTNFKNISNYK